MVKTRMNTADVASEVKCLRNLIGMRCANVYDLSSKIYVFKLMKSSGVSESGESEKVLLLVESGVRLHTTKFERDKSATPSAFTLKLRKHIRTRRLEDVRQLGVDRVVDFQFGLGEGAHHIILELYAQGNLLLTDANYNILILLRTYRDDEKGLATIVRHRYPVEACRPWERSSYEKLETGLIKSKTEADISIKDAHSSEKSDQQEQVSMKDEQRKKGSAKKESGGKWVKENLKIVVGDILGYGPALSEHIILSAGIQPNMKVFMENDNAQDMLSLNKDQLIALTSAVNEFENWLDDIVHGSLIPEGYIIMQQQKSGNSKRSTYQGKVYDEFSPILLKHYEGREHMKLDNFDAALDEFFSMIEGQRADQQRKSQEEAASQKLQKIKKDQANRIEALKKEVDQYVHMAELIEYNLEDVDAAVSAVRTALANGMDWKDLACMVKEERKAGNPVAGLIHSLQLEKNQITLLLSTNLDNMDEEERTRPVDKVEVDLSLSAHANARRWFDMKKKQAAKQEKTVSAHEKAFKAAERKTSQQLAQAKTVAAIKHMRKVHWFEKFNWFISSENYLVISGRDAQQNELIVKRYLKKGDIYVHADLHGASSTVIKNHDWKRPIPPVTLNQAGSFTVCHSQAWDSKIITSAWWVYSHQVSKTAPTGEYLTAGSFMIRGKKNFLPPHPLIMGFAIMFRLDESCLAPHLNERRMRGEGEDDVIEEIQEDSTAGIIDDLNDETYGSSEEGSNLSNLNAGRTGIALAAEKDHNDYELSRGKSGASVNNDNHDDDDDDNDDDDDDDDRKDQVSNDNDNNDEEGISTKLSTSADHLGNETKDPSLDGTDKSKQTTVLSQSSLALEELMDKALAVSSLSSMGKHDKYNLSIYPASVDATGLNKVVESLESSGKVSQREKPYISKAERRRQKKGTKDVLEENVEASIFSSTVSNTLSENSRNVPPSTAQNETQVLGAVKHGRGRKGKLKKIKEKYAEQDEEERDLRMALLASSGNTKLKDVGAVSKKDQMKALIPGDGREDTKVCYKCKQTGHLARDCPAAVSDHPPILPEEDIEGDPERAFLLAEENILELDNDEKDKLTELDSLTGNPSPDDILLYALPVCGPYGALQGYKYRVKLTPGGLKKGKAAKTALNLFGHMQDASAREKELMKAMTDPEMVAAIVSNSKLTAPGLTQLKKKQKKGKKISADEG